jgi:adenine-specific DNA-methyltransferase
LHGKTKVYYLGRGVFRGIGVSTCILVFEKGKNGAELYYRNDEKFVLSNVLNRWEGSILRFENEFTRSLEKSSVKLGELFDIKISARSTEVRNFGSLSYEKDNEFVPFLNGRNIKKGFITRDNYTHLWLKRSEVPQLKAFYKILPRIAVGHTKGGKIFAAIEDNLYPYVGDVYHLLPKTQLTRMELEKILNWLNSKEIEEYIKTLYKEITPHITKTQLKLTPLKYDEIKDRRLYLL